MCQAIRTAILYFIQRNSQFVDCGFVMKKLFYEASTDELLNWCVFMDRRSINSAIYKQLSKAITYVIVLHGEASIHLSVDELRALGQRANNNQDTVLEQRHFLQMLQLINFFSCNNCNNQMPENLEPEYWYSP